VGGGSNEEALRLLKRQLREQAKEMQRLQEMILENQRLFMGGMPGLTGGSVPAASAYPLATRLPATSMARGEMPYETRHALKKCLEKLGASDLKRAMELAVVSDGVLDLQVLDSARLWVLHDFCKSSSATKPRRVPQKASARSRAEALEIAREETERQLTQVRAARAAMIASSELNSPSLTESETCCESLVGTDADWLDTEVEPDLHGVATSFTAADDSDRDAEAADDLLLQMEEW
jgi:hypothetical protein